MLIEGTLGLERSSLYTVVFSAFEPQIPSKCHVFDSRHPALFVSIIRQELQGHETQSSTKKTFLRLDRSARAGFNAGALSYES